MKRALPLVALLAVTLGSAWLLKNLDIDELVTGSEPARAPDVFMRSFATTAMDESGRPRHRLTGRYMAHYPDTDTNEVEAPYLLVFRPPLEPWHVKAERGWVSANRQVILLLGDVHIWREGADGRRELDIHTSDLRVLPSSDYGETDKPVVITNRFSRSHGIGMRAYLEQGRVELLSQVKTRYGESYF